MLVGITGHRPEKIFFRDWVIDELVDAYRVTNASMIYQGMASGVDLWAAREAFYARIPYVCVRPWAGHRPRIDDRIDYEKALKHAHEVFNVSPLHEYTGPHLYTKRNEYIVDRVDVMIAVWDGSRSGTGNCVEYANDQGLPIFQINPLKKERGWLNYTPQGHGSTAGQW